MHTLIGHCLATNRHTISYRMGAGNGERLMMIRDRRAYEEVTLCNTLVTCSWGASECCNSRYCNYYVAPGINPITIEKRLLCSKVILES